MPDDVTRVGFFRQIGEESIFLGAYDNSAGLGHWLKKAKEIGLNPGRYGYTIRTRIPDRGNSLQVRIYGR